MAAISPPPPDGALASLYPGVVDAVVDANGFASRVVRADGALLTKAAPVAVPTLGSPDFSRNAVAWLPPGSLGNGLQGFWLFGSYAGDDGQNLKNLALFGADAALSGTPTYLPNYLTLGLGAYLTTTIPDTAQYTAFAVVRMRDPNPNDGCTIAATYGTDAAASGSGSSFGVLWTLATATNTALAGNIIARTHWAQPPSGTFFTPNPTLAESDLTQWKLCAITCDGRSVTVEDLTAGTAAVGTGPSNGYRWPNTSNKWQLGQDYSAYNKGLLDLAHIALYSRALTSAERAAHAAPIRAVLANRGITV